MEIQIKIYDIECNIKIEQEDILLDEMVEYMDGLLKLVGYRYEGHLGIIKNYQNKKVKES